MKGGATPNTPNRGHHQAIGEKIDALLVFADIEVDLAAQHLYKGVDRTLRVGRGEETVSCVQVTGCRLHELLLRRLSSQGP